MYITDWEIISSREILTWPNSQLLHPVPQEGYILTGNQSKFVMVIWPINQHERGLTLLQCHTMLLDEGSWHFNGSYAFILNWKHSPSSWQHDPWKWRHLSVKNFRNHSSNTVSQPTRVKFHLDQDIIPARNVQGKQKGMFPLLKLG